MSIWMELHCDVKIAYGGANMLPGQKYGDPPCTDYNGNHPMEMAPDRARMLGVWAYIKNQALKAGWTHHKGEWACKNCSALIAKTGRRR